MGFSEPQDLEHIVRILEEPEDPHLLELRRQAALAARNYQIAHQEMEEFADKVISYWHQMCEKVEEYKRLGKPCQSAAYVAGFANCEQEPFWQVAYQELQREHEDTNRSNEDMRILAYIR